MTEFSVETLHSDIRLGLRIDRLLFDSQTDHQRLRVFENARFGRVVTLDGVVQTTEADEFIYHEMISHVPVLAHGGVRHVLVIGGGDGGVARELFRHKGIEKVTMVEIDPSVIEFTKSYLPSIWAGAFDDPRLEIVIADGADFVKQGDAQSCDVIIVDSTDPVGPGEALFTPSFYQNASRLLGPNGIIVTQNGVPFVQGAELARTMSIFRGLFSDTTCYLAGIPTYIGGAMAFGWGTNGSARQTPADVLERRFANSGLATRYYSPDVHKAAFALPGYIRAAME